MNYSTDEAAKLIGRNKSTILRAIKAGKLSATRHTDKSLSIDASELARVYDLHPDERRHDAAMPSTAAAPTAPEAVELAVLRERVMGLEAQQEHWERERETLLSAHQETLADLRKRLDRAEERVLALSALPAQSALQMAQEPPPMAPAATKQPKGPKGFLVRLLGL